MLKIALLPKNHNSVDNTEETINHHNRMRDKIKQLKENLALTIVGKDEAIDLVLVGLISGGHVLLEDVPGVGKTLLAKSLAKSIDGKFQRVQCTPDLLPTDITGANIWNQGTREFQFLPGPIFCNILLADEINRATPRTQSALLEVMEERQVTVDGNSRLVPNPFFVIATQNPIEYQGTFPLPEAQMDRFALSLSLGYPSEAEELQMLQRIYAGSGVEELKPCISLDEVMELRKTASLVKVSQDIQEYILRFVRTTRKHEDITLGVSPRGAVALQKAVQCYAFLQGEKFVTLDDVKKLANDVLAHRIIPSGGKNARNIIEKLKDVVDTGT